MSFRKRGLRGDGWATPEFYGVKGGTGVNDNAALQAALTDLGNATSGGRLLLGPKTYRSDGLLNVPSNVSIIGVPDATYLAWNHATANGLVFLGDNKGPPVAISDIRFISLIGNTGSCIVNNAGARVQLARCSWNGFDSAGAASNNLQGNILVQTNAASSAQLVDCAVNVAGDAHGLNPTAGLVKIRGGSLKMPTTYTSALARATSSARVELDGVYMDFRSHTTGTAIGLSATSPARAAMRGCTLDASGGGGVNTTGFWWEEGTPVVSEGNDWILTGGSLQMYGSNLAAVGSRVEHLPLLSLDYSSSAGITFSALRSYEAINVRNDTNATIELPVGRVPGQVLYFTYFNGGASAVAVSFVNTPVTAQTIPGAGTLTAGNTLSAVFVWENRDVGPSYRWVQKGGWGVGLTLV